jgi:tetratricopeptide (TPR) repeat protein
MRFMLQSRAEEAVCHSRIVVALLLGFASCCLLLAPNWSLVAQRVPQAVEADVREGTAALERSDFASAEQRFSRALEAAPNLSQVRANLGLAYYADHKYPQAVDSFQLALRQDPSLQIPRTFLPLSLAALNRCDDAASGLRAEFARNPDVKLRRVIGLSLQHCLLQRGDQAEADQVMQKLLAQYPDDMDVLFEAGQMYAKLSSQVYLHLMKIAPRSARGYQVMGEVSAAEGNWEGAMDSYRKALKLDPGLPGAHLRLAVLLLQHSQDPDAWRQALDELNIELKLDPNNSEAEYETGEAYRKHGDPQHAVAAFRQALRFRPDFVEARLALAKVYRQEGSRQEALSTLEPARQSAPENAAVHFLLAQLYRDLGRAAEAQREEETFRRLQNPAQSN